LELGFVKGRLIVSEQAVIGHATEIMRARFMSGIGRISTDLSWLHAHGAEIRADVRTSVSAAAKDIEATQLRLTAQLDRLPAAQWERFKGMLTLLRAQQDVLDSAAALMLRARANAVPLRPPDAIAEPGALGHEEGPVLRKRPLAKWSSKSALFGAVSLRLALVVMLAAGLIFLYATFPRDGKRQGSAVEGAAVTRDSGAVASLPTPQKRAPAAVLSEATPTALMPTAREAPRATDGTISLSQLPLPSFDPRAVPAPSITDQPEPATPRAGSERFVPVVFTDKDKARVLQTFADLKMRYPRLLGRRRAEAQPVDVGQKGIWHRLVILPPGSRQSATDFCDQLLAAGYERCWVKDY